MRPHNLRQTVFLTALLFQGCGFTYEPDPGSMAHYDPEAPNDDADAAVNRLDEGQESPGPLAGANENLHVVEAAAPDTDGCEDEVDPVDARCQDAGIALEIDAGPTDAVADMGAPPPDRVSGALCSAEQPCEADLVCLHDPVVQDTETGDYLPYCTTLCDEEECPEGYHCVDVEPMTRICRRDPQE